MLNVAADISQLVHSIKSLDDVGVKVASAEGSAIAQHTTAQASMALYNVIVKCANDFVPDVDSTHRRIVTFIDKVAEVLQRPEVPDDIRLKLAAAVTADDAISAVLQTESNPAERTKLAEARVFGREFVMELLQGVI